MTNRFNIAITWDNESQKCMASSNTLGLVTGADSIEELFVKLSTLVPELLRERERTGYLPLKT
jgi:hypothetical protein